MMSSTDCPIQGKTSLKRPGETASWGEPDGLIWPTRSCKNDSDTGSNFSKTAEQGTGSAGSDAGVEMRVLTVAIILIKN